MEDSDPWLFDVPAAPPTTEPKVRPLDHPIWTENKARLIREYLFLFLQVTKHGIYVDGFAGPQKPNKPAMWAAKLVVELEPRWLRHLHLFEKDKRKARLLRALRDAQPGRNGPAGSRQRPRVGLGYGAMGFVYTGGAFPEPGPSAALPGLRLRRGLTPCPPIPRGPKSRQKACVRLQREMG